MARPNVVNSQEIRSSTLLEMARSIDDFRFVAYDECDDVPNIVVDGSPNTATVLTLTHWPGVARPSGYERDLSAQMAFAFLDQPIDTVASVVTNNHYDQDGLVSAYALIEPEAAQEHRELLIDLAAAGDFATYRHRAAARASMTVAAYADPERSPIETELEGMDYAPRCARLYEITLQLVPAMLRNPDRFRDSWAEEDSHLTSDESAITDGSITIDEHPFLDLAVVTIPESAETHGGHRFGSGRFENIHPMALHNATECLRILVVSGRRYSYTDRYETWVQYQTRRPLPRVDLAPLAKHLTAEETGISTWSADPPSGLAPTLRCEGDSSLDPEMVIGALSDHLRTAPAAWDPYT
jgi:hypothetical protein